MVTLREHRAQWVTAAPLWSTAVASPAVMRRPALLRFESDSFMEDLADVLATAPAKLLDRVAHAESYRQRPVGEGPDWRALPEGAPLKLFQPVHGHFNLVAATLVCPLPGMPDRALDPNHGDKVGFVLRRLDTNGDEMAWSAVSDGKMGWQLLPGESAQRVAPKEELLPMFPMPFTENNRRRRLLVGLVPTSSRETFQSAPTLPVGVPPEDQRPEEFKVRVLGVLEGLRLAPPGSTDPLTILQQQDASMFLLLDFADFLKKHNIDVIDGSEFNAAQLELRNWLAGTEMLPGTNWLEALRFAWQKRHQINGEDVTPLANPYNLANNAVNDAFLGELESRVRLALGDLPASAPPDAAKVELPKFDAEGGARYVVRCAYLRPTCKPPHADVLSTPTMPFQLAPFFDPDAPARPIRIPLPVDTSVAGLRKFARNVAFMNSDKLRNQASTLGPLKDILSGDLKPGGKFSLGEICSFSLPIITLCAMIVLIIFVILLNIVFFWLPMFRICLPIPLSSKKGGA